MTQGVQIAKIDAARRQLIAAIDLYFRSADSIAIHTLAAAARNVLANLCKHRALESTLLFERMLADAIKPEHHDMLRKQFRKPENFFKHAERDPNQILTFNPEVSELWILEGIEAYAQLTQELPPIFLAFRGWWMTQHPDDFTDLPPQPALAHLHFQPDERTRFIQEFMAAYYMHGDLQVAVLDKD